MDSSSAPSDARDAVTVASEKLPDHTPVVAGEDFSAGVDIDSMMRKMLTTGFQATNVGLAVQEINRMLEWRLSDKPIRPDEPDELIDMNIRRQIKCKIFLSYTSNMISSGVRETIRFLVQHNMVDCIVTTGGGIEEDIMKCLAPTYVGDFKLNGEMLRKKGLNRIGNLLVPNNNYCAFEDWISPILHTITDEQINDGTRWTPSRLIRRLGKEIDNPESVYYWCYRNDIPVFCPAITDGSLGDMLYFHSYKRPELQLDLVDDIRAINDIAVRAHCTGMIILGGGLVKHHTCNANLMRNGAEFAVYINTGQEFDGSDSGASPDEAVSWGKIKMTSNPVKVFTDATLVFPLIVSQTFYKEVKRRTELADE
eukprot:CAMPEP_0185021674 /NCGR_PEP_ID=MMETSP1103-20130426/4380_1 /TAXON_ID=36769 /ORGANISM="Paraphysomonas bandaiensis, Strain Caron Lab Isolate" /LENGTH=366 /DNA_ID=CAMNT_0027553353 /DNA_START=62 /DNA_END=1159 /DNA_ORIENTATION=+